MIWARLSIAAGCNGILPSGGSTTIGVAVPAAWPARRAVRLGREEVENAEFVPGRPCS
jgi:hypothetical protein